MLLTANDIKTAVDYLVENEGYKLIQWTSDTFGWLSPMAEHLRKGRYSRFADVLVQEYSLDVQLELVELMYN